MKRSILALTTLLTATLTLSGVARANEQTDRQSVVNRYQAIMKATVKDAYYDINKHPADAVLMNSDTMLASKLIETNPSGNFLKQQNNQLLNIQLNKQVTNPLVGSWKASVFEYGQRVEIFVIFKSNGIVHTSFIHPNGNILTKTSRWHYSGNILTEIATDGEIAKGSIEFVNSNYFVVTILTNSGPASAGLKRHYYRDSP